MKINKKCECIDCPTCKGDWRVWVSGNIIEAYRFNDEGDSESCPDCGGEGVSSYCLKCALEDESDEEKWGIG